MSEENFSTGVADLVNAGQEELLLRLESLANSRAVSGGGGPIGLGRACRLTEVPAIEEMAAHYRASVADGIRHLPYFEEVETPR